MKISVQTKHINTVWVDKSSVKEKKIIIPEFASLNDQDFAQFVRLTLVW